MKERNITKLRSFLHRPTRRHKLKPAVNSKNIKMFKCKYCGEYKENGEIGYLDGDFICFECFNKEIGRD